MKTNSGLEFSEFSPSEDACELLTVDEVAQRLKVPKSWIYERTRSRGAAQIPHIKLGKYIRFEEDAVRMYLNRQRHGHCGIRNGE